MNIEFRPAAREDARNIVPALRDRDLAILRSYGEPSHVIEGALQASTTSFVALADGMIGAMWGVRHITLLDNQCYLWMVGTVLIDDHPIHFLRHSRNAVQIMHERYRVIYGECEYDYSKSMRWLTWLGAKVWAPDLSESAHLVFVLKGD